MDVSLPSTSILPRLAGRKIELALQVMPAVVVSGARQTGKTTLVRSLPALEEHLYATLDDYDVQEQARAAPEALVQRAPRMVLDEVQREAALLSAVKRAIDREHGRRPGRFVLTGSANLLLARRVSESLAGRATYVTLWPLTRRELRGHGSAGAWSLLLDRPCTDWRDALLEAAAYPEDWRALVTGGGYPTPAYELRDSASRALWFDGYVRTYLERDLQDLAAIGNLVDFRRLMRAASQRLGNLLNQAELARDVGVSHATACRHMALLEVSHQVVRLEPYSVNRTKRLVRSPKVYWSDTGLALHLAGAGPSGAHLENLVLVDLLAWRDSDPSAPTGVQVLFYRTHGGHEVDFVLEHGHTLIAVEVKTSGRPRARDLRGLRVFREEYGSRVKGSLVLHDGEETSWLEEGVLGVPWWRVL